MGWRSSWNEVRPDAPQACQGRRSDPQRCQLHQAISGLSLVLWRSSALKRCIASVVGCRRLVFTYMRIIIPGCCALCSVLRDIFVIYMSSVNVDTNCSKITRSLKLAARRRWVELTDNESFSYQGLVIDLSDVRSHCPRRLHLGTLSKGSHQVFRALEIDIYRTFPLVPFAK